MIPTFTSLKINSSRLFSIILIIVSILPLLATYLTYNFPKIIGSLNLVSILILIGSTHVFGTVYLFSDKNIRLFFLSHPIKMIIIPVSLIISSVIIIGNPENNLFVPAAMAYILYGIWHFGSQNVGVATFISLSTQKKSLPNFQKRILQMSAFTGMLGVLKIRQPDFGVGKENIHVNESLMTFIDNIYFLGSIVAVILTIVMFVTLIPALKKGKYFYCLSLMIMTVFLFTMYITSDRILGFGAFAAAHGLQYIVFLASHSMKTNSKTKKSFTYRLLIPIFFLLGVLITGWFIWSNQNNLNGMNNDFALLGVGLINGITLAHFWVDQYLWKMKNQDRKEWVSDKFDFIFK